MVFKEFINKLGEKSRERKEKIKELDEQVRLQKLIEDRQKSSNERELEKYMNEEREEEIKQALEQMRKKRDKDIKFNHNPLNIQNITNSTQWEVLKEKNMFAGGKANMFQNDNSVLKNNPNLLKNNRSLMK